MASKTVGNKDASVIFDIGCLSNIRKLYLKNVPKSFGGTKNFTLYVSNNIDGGWQYLLSEQLKQGIREGCSQTLQIFPIDLT